MPILAIKNAELSIDNKKILKGLSLNVNEGETHAIMAVSYTHLRAHET